MTRGEQHFHIFAKALAWEAIILMVLAMLSRYTKFGGDIILLKAFGGLGFCAFLVSPLIYVAGLAQAAFVRLRMHLERRTQETRPSFFVFAAGILTTFFMRFTFKLVPLFPGDASVQRGAFDDWLDWLL
ncbi:MAG: hypothetical protein HYV26_15580 [Candidatus Hydrogenedentes bacterium]|nr:hypothetical protein [Candidatus Hydrogenedentota bacterium]